MPHGGTKVDHTVLYVIVAVKEKIRGFVAYKYPHMPIQLLHMKTYF